MRKSTPPKAPLALTPSDGDASKFTIYIFSLRRVSSSLLPSPSLLSVFFLCLIVWFDGQDDYDQGIGAYTVTCELMYLLMIVMMNR